MTLTALRCYGGSCYKKCHVKKLCVIKNAIKNAKFLCPITIAVETAKIWLDLVLEEWDSHYQWRPPAL